MARTRQGVLSVDSYLTMGKLNPDGLPRLFTIRQASEYLGLTVWQSVNE